MWITSGAQNCPLNPDTTFVIQAGGEENTRGPVSHFTMSRERREPIPCPVQKIQYSSPHLTIVEGS